MTKGQFPPILQRSDLLTDSSLIAIIRPIIHFLFTSLPVVCQIGSQFHAVLAWWLPLIIDSTALTAHYTLNTMGARLVRQGNKLFVCARQSNSSVK